MRPRVLLVLEEFHRIGGAQLKERADLQDLLPSDALRTIRAAQGGVLVLDQVPSQIPPAVLANVLTKVFFRLTSGQCLFTATTALALTPQERDVLAELPDRQALVGWPLEARPFCLRVPEIRLPAAPSDAEVLARQSAAAEAQRFVPCPGPAAPEARAAKPPSDVGLLPDEREELAVLAKGPATIEEIIQRCGWDRGRENRARSRLVFGLFVKAESLGNKRRILYLTDKGAALCDSLGIAVAKYHSGPVHEFLRRIACAGLLAAFPGAKELRTGAINGAQPDARIVDQARGLVIGLQVVWSKNPEHEAGAAKKLLDAANGQGLDRVVLLCRSAALCKTVERALRAELNAILGPPLRPRLVLLDVEQVLKPGFSWPEALGIEP